jgi:glycosyltransferase involved in cell wall biosynthesis
LVIDDGSTDATEGLLHDYCKKDTRFRYHKRPKDRLKGANACRNYGFELSNGGYINWFDSDDIMLPEKLELQVKQLETQPDNNYSICQTAWIDRNDGSFIGLRSKSICSETPWEDYICYRIFWSILAPLWRRSFIEAHNIRFDETLQQSQEYDFHIRALAIDPNYMVLDQPMVEMYRHETNLSNNWLHDDAKVASNIRVKFKTLYTYADRLSPETQFKLLEFLTLTYKDLLCLKRFYMAKALRKTLVKALSYVPLNRTKRFHFYLRTQLIYLSYRIFGRGYGLLKPVG